MYSKYSTFMPAFQRTLICTLRFQSTHKFCNVGTKIRSPVSAIHTHIQHYIGNVFLFLYGEHFLTLGATFFLLARLFFKGTTFFSLVRLFLTGTTFFSPARLFFRWRDFFSPARLFFAGATSLALICRPLLNFIAGSSYEHVYL